MSKRTRKAAQHSRKYLHNVKRHFATKFGLSYNGMGIKLVAKCIGRETGWTVPSDRANQWKLIGRYAIEIMGWGTGVQAECYKIPADVVVAAKRKRQTREQFNAFYQTKEWRQLRFKALLKYGRKCMCCNATNKVLHVDHVKPRSKYPELELELSNLQILCEDCNMGKGGWSEADFREAETPEEVPAELNEFDAAFKDTIGKPN